MHAAAAFRAVVVASEALPPALNLWGDPVLAGQGKAILLISSDLPEVLGMSHRILVMHQGRIAGEITDVAQATQQDIMRLAIGGL